jgi:CDP-diacylglycerol--glycerol-3-phosphate 3-phosphatidyltransferase
MLHEQNVRHDIDLGRTDDRQPRWAPAVLNSVTSAGRLAGSWLPQTPSLRVLALADSIARRLVGVGVSANAVTLASLALSGTGAALVALSRFGWAAGALLLSSLGDALDGAVARRSGTASVRGALLDAAADRYGELLLLGGLAVRFRASVPWLVTILAAIAGSFMVSYGSAKAEALAARVPPSAMRRPERAVCLCVGIAATAALEALASRGALATWGVHLPLLLALGLIAVVGNTSAVRRLRLVATTHPTARTFLVTSVPPAPPADAGALRTTG